MSMIPPPRCGRLVRRGTRHRSGALYVAQVASLGAATPGGAVVAAGGVGARSPTTCAGGRRRCHGSWGSPVSFIATEGDPFTELRRRRRDARRRRCRGRVGRPAAGWSAPLAVRLVPGQPSGRSPVVPDTLQMAPGRGNLRHGHAGRNGRAGSPTPRVTGGRRGWSYVDGHGTARRQEQLFPVSACARASLPRRTGIWPACERPSPPSWASRTTVDISISPVFTAFRCPVTVSIMMPRGLLGNLTVGPCSFRGTAISLSWPSGTKSAGRRCHGGSWTTDPAHRTPHLYIRDHQRPGQPALFRPDRRSRPVSGRE